MDHDWQTEVELILRALMATALGGLIGWERGRDRHDAGVRTYAAVALGSCVFALVGHGGDARDRIAAQVVSGLGFLGAGVILREQGEVRGLTTAATLWATASVGLSVAYGSYLLALVSTALMVGLLYAHQLPGWQRLMRHGKDPPGCAGEEGATETQRHREEKTEN
jgi:putative Mg2+ transporter-C (MgtC) family protein